MLKRLACLLLSWGLAFTILHAKAADHVFCQARLKKLPMLERSNWSSFMLKGLWQTAKQTQALLLLPQGQLLTVAIGQRLGREGLKIIAINAHQVILRDDLGKTYTLESHEKNRR